MIRNYLKIAFRNLWRHRAFSFINILGLTVGMTAFFLIFLYVQFELGYDGWHTKGDRIFRVVADIKTPTETINANTPAWAVGAHIKREFPNEIEAAVRLGYNSMLVRRGDVKFQEDNTLYADSALFRIFDFPLLKGNPATALRDPYSVVMTETTAKKYFGKEDPLGKTVLLSADGNNATVTGVMKDIPENSIIRADMLVSMTSLTQQPNSHLDDAWGNYGNRTFILLKPGVNYKSLQARLPQFLEKMNGREMKESQMYPTLFLEPLKSVYLYSPRENKVGNIKNVYIFIIIGVFILLIACFNFVNLTTARSAERAKEVGVRKVVGAARSQLARQFIGESVILCLIAFILSIGLSALLFHQFIQLSGKIIGHNIFEHPGYLLMLLGVAVIIGILAGVYPALVLSSFQPITVLKGRFTTGSKGSLLRKGLVVAQFTISISLIIGTIIVYSQLKYMRSEELGFTKDQKLILDTHGDKGRDALRQAIAGLPGVNSVTLAGSVPGGGNPGAYSQIENAKGDMQIANLDLYFVDFEYIPQYKMKVLAGRAFSRDFMTDTTQSMMVNEAAMKMFGYSKPEQIIGRKFDQWGRKGVIIGVLKDFHFRGLQDVIKPLSVRIEPDGCNLISVQLAGGKDISGTISGIEAKWKSIIPNRPFSYYFLDEYFDRQYRSEDRFGRLFLNFAILAIFISCLGLLGLAAYSTLQRTKEIGIRKVLGASVGAIVNLLSKEFLALVAISFLIAAPLSWYFMDKWLAGFVYRMSIGWWVFAVAGIMALFIALFTVSFQAIKAAVANPVKSLRVD